MPPKSKFWKYFSKKDNNVVVCLLCGKSLKTSGNTTNLKNHLKATHPKVELTAVAYKEPRQVQDNQPSTSASNNSENILIEEDDIEQEGASTTEGTDTCSSVSGNSSICTQYGNKHFKRQKTINETFSQIVSYEVGGNKYNKITTSILYMICHDYQPISIVEDKGFRQLLRVTAPSYKIPSRKTFGALLDQKYLGISSLYKTQIQVASAYCLTADVWTEPFNTKSFLGITIHFLQNYKLVSLNIGVYELDESHTGEYIARKLKSICEEWDIKNENITAVITDGASNMKLAVELLIDKHRHIHCFAHQINLVVERAIKGDENLCDLISRIRKIVTWFKKSNIASDELRKAQKKEQTIKKLKQDVATRWNSSFYMIERFLELREHVNIIVNKFDTAPVMVSGREIKELELIKKLLEPFELATKEISGEKYVTASIIIPLVYNLEGKIKEVKLELSNETAVKLKSNLLAEISKRLGAAEQVQLLATATLLDPRFKKIYFRDILNCGKAVDYINNLMKGDTSSSREIIPSEIDDSKPKEKIGLWGAHQKIVQEKSLHLQEHETVSEISMFLKNEVVRLDSDPLEWWQKHQEIYPKLTKIAKKFLAVVATSVPSERLFSKAGHTITERRNRLSGEKLNKILFLHSVDKTCWE